MSRGSKRRDRSKIANVTRQGNVITLPNLRPIPGAELLYAKTAASGRLGFGPNDILRREARYFRITQEKMRQRLRNEKRNRHLKALGMFEDRRLWSPDRQRAAKAFRRSMARLVAPTAAVVAFRRPSGVLICVRRKIRREVMFAKSKAGRRGQRRPRFNYYSQISCRR